MAMKNLILSFFFVASVWSGLNACSPDSPSGSLFDKLPDVLHDRITSFCTFGDADQWRLLGKASHRRARRQVLAILMTDPGFRGSARDVRKEYASHVAKGERALAPDWMHSQLCYAAASGQKSKMQRLLKAPYIDVNHRCMGQYVVKDGHTPLHAAAHDGSDQSDSVNALLADPRVDFNVRDSHGNTALHIALRRHNNKSIIALLADPRVDCNLRNEDNDTILDVALYRGSHDILTQLLFHPSTTTEMLNATDARGNTMLMRAIIITGTRRYSPVNAPMTNYIPLLADARVDCNLRNHDGDTALHIAATNGNTDAVEVLVTNVRVDCNARDSHGNTALHIAAAHGYADMVKKLLANSRVDCNVRNEHGDTALHIAATNGYANMVKELLADKRLDSEQIAEARECAKRNGHAQIVSMIDWSKSSCVIQ
jgi:ankyrin repeat protein